MMRQKIDTNYGDVMYPIYNVDGQANYDKIYDNPVYKINKGDRLAQLVIVPIITPELEQVEEFDSESARGEKGLDHQESKDILTKVKEVLGK